MTRAFYPEEIGIPNVLETLFKEYKGGVKYDHCPKVKVKLNIVSLKLPVAAYLGQIDNIRFHLMVKYNK